MKQEQINALLRERAALQRMLADSPEDELIERRCLCSRIDTINHELGGDFLVEESQGKKASPRS